MAIARTTAEREYVLKCDLALPENERTVFLLKPLTARQRMQMQDRLRHEMVTVPIKGENKDLFLPMNSGEVAIEKLLLALVGWRNFHYPEGAELPFDAVRENNLQYLEDEWILELAAAVDDMDKLTEAQAKN